MHRIPIAIPRSTVTALAGALAAMPAVAQDAASLILHAPATACEQARLGERVASRGADGAFRFDAVPVGAHRLTCGRPLDVYLVAKGALRVTTGEHAPRFDGAGAAANAYLHAPREMDTPRFAALWTADTPAFARAWDAAYAADRRALSAVADGDGAFREREEMRLRMRHAWGRVVHPYFHWRETAAPDVVPYPGLDSLAVTLPLGDARWWPLPEHAALVDALVHERARALLASDARLRTGDVRWLRAELAAADSVLRDPALRHRVTARLIESHVDENGSRGMDPVLAGWRALDPDPATVRRVDSLVADDRAQREGHPVAVYQTVDGVELEAHVLRPDSADTTFARPAMLWFHGGSWTTGTWWHSPGVVSALRRNGITVVAAEYRTGARFDAGPLEQMEDAAAAYTWLTRNAARFGIDPRRVGVAGFSSGATLALILATRGIEAATAGTDARTFPAAVIVTGACADPAGPREDGFFRKRVARRGDPSDWSPLHRVAAGQPPTLVIQGTEDEYCAYDEVRAFVERSAAAGNDTELDTVEGAGHFFGFYHPPGQRQMRESIAATLRRWGWSTP